MPRPEHDTEARFPALPVGRLGARALHDISVGRLVHFRAGPWVALGANGSRLVRVIVRSGASNVTDLVTRGPLDRVDEDLPAAVPASGNHDHPAAAHAPDREEVPAAAAAAGDGRPPSAAAPRAVVFTTASGRLGAGRPHRPRGRRRSERP